jgi:hypothetical protein
MFEPKWNEHYPPIVPSQTWFASSRNAGLLSNRPGSSNAGLGCERDALSTISRMGSAFRSVRAPQDLLSRWKRGIPLSLSPGDDVRSTLNGSGYGGAPVVSVHR